MNRENEKIELFSALSVEEVEARVQNGWTYDCSGSYGAV
jgi:hypothetical protein